MNQPNAEIEYIEWRNIKRYARFEAFKGAGVIFQIGEFQDPGNKDAP